MSKDITVKIIKAFEIKQGSKYILILPSYIAKDEKISAAIHELFLRADSQFVGLMLNNPEDAKVLEVKQKPQ
jgi:hypothetical protein